MNLKDYYLAMAPLFKEPDTIIDFEITVSDSSYYSHVNFLYKRTAVSNGSDFSFNLKYQCEHTFEDGKTRPFSAEKTLTATTSFGTYTLPSLYTNVKPATYRLQIQTSRDNNLTHCKIEGGTSTTIVKCRGYKFVSPTMQDFNGLSLGAGCSQIYFPAMRNLANFFKNDNFGVRFPSGVCLPACATSCANMFQGYRSTAIDVTNLFPHEGFAGNVDFDYVFYGCKNFTGTIPEWLYDNGGSHTYCFRGCDKLQKNNNIDSDWK